MPTLTLTQADNGKSVTVRQGDVVSIQLEENPTTGFQWAVDHLDAETLELTSSDYTRPSSAVMGSGGERTFSLTAKKPGTAPVALKLWREWQGESSVTDRFNVTVVVSGE